MIALARYYPLGDSVELNGVFYTWAFIDREEGTLQYSVNHEPLRTVNLSQTSADFRRYIQERALERSDSEQATKDRARERALEILETGDPRAFILDTFKTQHIGDNETAEGILIGTANQSIANSKGVQPAVYGESGTGKSHAARAMLHLFPERYYMIETLSDKAIFYMAVDELRAGMTIFSDDANITEGIESLIKRSTAFFQEETVHRVATKEGGKWTAKKHTVPPRINWLLTSVDSQGSEQLINRQIGFGVDESTTQDEKVTEFELNKARDGLPEFNVTEDVLTCREILLNMKEDKTGTSRLFTAKIPFAERIEWLDKKNRRNLPIFLDMVKGYAVLNFKQRSIVDGALIATEDDFRAAERLYNTRGGFQKLHINEREKEMIQHIADNAGELSTEELMQKLTLSRSRVRQLADRLETVLPSFYVEKRSENVKDDIDDSKRTTTQRNYYCYSGAVTIDLFASVVSLRRPTPEEAEEESGCSGDSADAERMQGEKLHLVSMAKEAQNKQIQTKESNNNNIINNKYNPIRADAEKNGSIYAHARVCSNASCASGLESPQSEAENKSISELETGDGFKQKLQVGCIRNVSGVQALYNPEDLSDFEADLDDIIDNIESYGKESKKEKEPKDVAFLKAQASRFLNGEGRISDGQTSYYQWS